MWFHTGITRETAEERLEHSSSGCFLVRESKTKVGCFSLSLKHPGGIAHFTIERKDSGLYEVTGTHKGFTSLPNLIDHFKNHPISEYPHRQLHDPCSKFIHSGEGRSAWLAQALPTPSHNLDLSSLAVEDTPPLVPTQTTPPPVPLPRRRLTAGKHTANTFNGKEFPNGKHLPTDDLLQHSNLVKYVHVADQFCACYEVELLRNGHHALGTNVLSLTSSVHVLMLSLLDSMAVH